MPKILLVEDERRLSGYLVKGLENSGYAVDAVCDGEEALYAYSVNDYDLVVLDLNLPDGSGLELLRRLRTHSALPVLILTANDLELDQVTGLELGADDYVTKPFSLAVLRARVNNLLRRAHSHSAVLELPPFTFDFQKMAYTRNGVPLELSRTEQRLLRLLAEHRGQTLSRARLLEQVWDGGEFVDENALSVAVKRLRSKLTDAPIRTIYGVGYVWAVEP